MRTASESKLSSAEEHTGLLGEVSEGLRAAPISTLTETRWGNRSRLGASARPVANSIFMSWNWAPSSQGFLRSETISEPKAICFVDEVFSTPPDRTNAARKSFNIALRQEIFEPKLLNESPVRVVNDHNIIPVAGSAPIIESYNIAAVVSDKRADGRDLVHKWKLPFLRVASIGTARIKSSFGTIIFQIFDGAGILSSLNLVLKIL